MEYDNNNTGALFKNDKKQSDRHPDYTGSCEINNVEMWMSAWIKTSQHGKKFMSFSFNPKEIQSAPVSVKAANDVVDFDDDIPF
ncbi:MAG TPA: hypothetical protein DCR60_07760 [Psychrobacter sp.]|nr:hypothetical protein [Psychrobacter sp.]|tara:strand:- start:1503 stop:1754 length:252 start_codon:yes stop_codon:yes gene_type:complete